MRVREKYTLPNFLIIGAMKAGTTSLVTYFNEHPDIFMPKHEVCFFNRDELWHAGPERYSSFFSKVKNEKMIGEKSPAYSFNWKLHPSVPERIARLLPNAKLIWCLRNPVDRAFSHYWHNVFRGREKASFERVLSRSVLNGGRSLGVCIERGMYINQIRDYLKVFPAKQMHFIVSETLFSDTQRILREAFEFLEVDSTFKGKRVHKVFNSGKQVARFLFLQRALYNLFNRRYPDFAIKFQRLNNLAFSYNRPEMNRETRKTLQEFYEPYNRELAQELGLDLSSWNEALGEPHMYRKGQQALEAFKR